MTYITFVLIDMTFNFVAKKNWSKTIFIHKMMVVLYWEGTLFQVLCLWGTGFI